MRRSSSETLTASTPMESLERRLLFSVTLNNGLPTNDPNFFQVTLGVGDSVAAGGAILGNTPILNKYSAFLDLGTVPVFGDEVCRP